MKTDLYTLLNIGTILFTSIIYASIDIFLLELYLKNTFESKNINDKNYYLVEFMLFFILNTNVYGIYRNPISKIIIFQIIVLITFSKYRATNTSILKTSILYSSIISILELIIKSIFQYIFNYQLS